MTALVFLFLAEAQRAFVPALFWLVGAGLAPAFRPGPSLAALLLLAALALPLIPVARFVDRTGAVVLAAVAVALFRLPMTLPAVAVRPAAAALTLACAGAYVMSAVGHVDRRAIAAGALAGLAADQLLRLAGGSWDLTLRPEWLPVQAVLSLGLVGVAVLWSRTAAEPGRPE